MTLAESPQTLRDVLDRRAKSVDLPCLLTQRHHDAALAPLATLPPAYSQVRRSLLQRLDAVVSFGGGSCFFSPSSLLAEMYLWTDKAKTKLTSIQLEGDMEHEMCASVRPFIPVSANVMNQITREVMLYDAQEKGSGVAYLWWFLLGFLGVHRFYLKRPGSGIAQAIASIGGTWLAFRDTGDTTGWVPAVIGGLRMLVDVFLIPGMVRTNNTALAE